MYSAEPLPHFVDEYLAYLHEVHPTSATFDGVHLNDDLLEDLSRQAIDGQVRDLGGFARRLGAIGSGRLTETERLERPALEANIRTRLFELEQVRTWERNPQHYADLISTSLASQALFDYAPLSERARRIASKLRQVPRLIQAARDNIKDPPGIFVKVGLESLRGTQRFIDVDLPRAFSKLGDLHVLGDLADTSIEASAAIAGYIDYLEKDLAPRSKGSFRLGRERFEEKLRLDEGLALDADRLLAIATRELDIAQEEFRRVASKLNGGDPAAVWEKVKADHPPAGQLVTAAQEQLGELSTFINRNRIITIPEGAPVHVAPTPAFYRWTFASMWTPGPFESRPLPATYYLTDVDHSWAAERQAEHLRDFSYAALWSISIHEVFPGHFLHYQHLRKVESKWRKSIMFSSTAFVGGWAHYCEQMMLDEGFKRGDHAVRLGQLAEALIRLCRFIVGIRLHCEDMSVEQGVRFFREQAFLEEASARREAERGTFDPSYILYTAGKLMLMKLREDYKARVGDKFSTRGFHDALLANGTVPVWLHRALMLGEQNGAALE
ncbi:MAG TPA: DUF885 domain-containing protein [Vicinamibacterales bacterium]|nr:DUF885 domain-containing protein [Vicinamibacterales bacterium]